MKKEFEGELAKRVSSKKRPSKVWVMVALCAAILVSGAVAVTAVAAGNLNGVENGAGNGDYLNDCTSDECANDCDSDNCTCDCIGDCTCDCTCPCCDV